MESKEALQFLSYGPWSLKLFNYMEEKSLVGTKVVATIHLDGATVASKKTLESSQELVSYLLQMNFAKAEVNQCIIVTQILNK